ncbi:MAG: cytochrome B [Flavobacteriales bacterium]|nr:cytochrome B [Flavobacteriales bacterium]MCB9178907.1 cytochrome B [Flavobacteriales bacterium]
MDNPFLVFAHSLIRYGVLITVAWAGLVHLRGLLFKRPILTYERAMSIVAMVLCHVQLVIGLILYLMNFKQYAMMQGPEGRFWKMEHIGTMVIAIALVTIGRSTAKRAQDEQVKQKRIAIFYLIALALMLWAIPWPFTQLGHGRSWL